MAFVGGGEEGRAEVSAGLGGLGSKNRIVPGWPSPQGQAEGEESQ